MSNAYDFRFRKPAALHHDEIRNFTEGIVANESYYVISALCIILNSGVRSESFACEASELHRVGPDGVLILA